ncbi:hypothetical protein N7492_008622 [Penicillium capsulatum]|uniref:Mid2 domain-containing protein n=1 Tax=Penicillium capsulatum TaxID=69766 RepID=A0A9W9LGY5_9EURO|nr:hypothetical protein N7492_008622 [Penicillium capsulatum]KAJ6106027.1 hypothetical protein N7512_009544 [Penicillium capsulatum]
MAHGHFRHSRISRLINAKHRREEALQASNGGQTPNLLGAVDAKSPIHSPDILSAPCDPLQNLTCPEDVPDTTERSLPKRQAADSPSTTHVETIVQVVDTNSHTLWQSIGVNYPMTISDPVLGVVTISDSLGLSASAALLIPTPPVISPATQPRTSATPTPPSKHIAAFSSSSHSVTNSSHRSTPLAHSSSTTSSTRSSVTSTTHSSTSTSSTSSDSIWSSSTSSDIYGNGGSATSTGDVPPPATSSSQPSGSGSAGDNTTPKIVGGVIGSVAGLAMIVLLILFLLRRRNFFQAKGTQALPSNDGTREISERPSSHDALFSPSYLAPAFMKRWRQSTMTTATDSTVDSSNTSERGFQKISGRKIPPVLTHGGDGFGGGLEGGSPTVPHCLIGLSPTSPGRPLSLPHRMAHPRHRHMGRGWIPNIHGRARNCTIPQLARYPFACPYPARSISALQPRSPPRIPWFSPKVPYRHDQTAWAGATQATTVVVAAASPKALSCDLEPPRYGTCDTTNVFLWDLEEPTVPTHSHDCN